MLMSHKAKKQDEQQLSDREMDLNTLWKENSRGKGEKNHQSKSQEGEQSMPHRGKLQNKTGSDRSKSPNLDTPDGTL